MIAHENENDVIMLRTRADERCRVNKNTLPFPAGQAGRHQDDSLSRSDAPCLAQRFHALRSHGCRIEARFIKAPVNDANAVGGLGVTLAHDARRILGIADDGVAACHHAVVVGFEAAVLVINAMVGRYKAALGSASRSERAPGGRPAPRVDEADAALANEARKPQDIEQHQAGVFRFGGEADQFAPDIGQLLFEPAAGGYDKRKAATKRYGFGDFDCCPLGAPGG